MKGTPLVQGVLEPVGSGDEPGSPEVSVVMPCLNEADTLGTCIDKPRVHARARDRGEVIVADNGSTDGSSDRASAWAPWSSTSSQGLRQRVDGRHWRSARPIRHHGRRGRSAMTLRRSRSSWRSSARGYDLVQGCRLAEGRRHGLPGAMPLLHRWLGNPCSRCWCGGCSGAPIHDVYCGLRGFTKAILRPARPALHRDGVRDGDDHQVQPVRRQHRGSADHAPSRRPQGHAPHLKTFRDGWRTLRFFLMSSPRWLFLMPGRGAHSAGVLVTLGPARADDSAASLRRAHAAVLEPGDPVRLPGHPVRPAFEDVCGDEGLLPPIPASNAFLTRQSGSGLSPRWRCRLWAFLLAGAVDQWRAVDFGRLDYATRCAGSSLARP